LKALDFESLLPKVKVPSLIVHGEEDSLAPVEGVRQIMEFFGGPVDLNIVPQGDHMCSDTLIDRELPLIMDWFQNERGVKDSCSKLFHCFDPFVDWLTELFHTLFLQDCGTRFPLKSDWTKSKCNPLQK